MASLTLLAAAAVVVSLVVVAVAVVVVAVVVVVAAAGAFAGRRGIAVVAVAADVSAVPCCQRRLPALCGDAQSHQCFIHSFIHSFIRPFIHPFQLREQIST